MNITPSQRLSIAALVATGLLGSAAVLWSGKNERPAAAGEAHRHDEPGAKTAAARHEAGEAKGPDRDDLEEERRVALSAAQQARAGITVTPAGPAALQAASDFQGEVRFNEDRTAHVVPHLAGVAASVDAHQGQQVRAGQVLAVIASPALSEQRSELLAAQRRLEAAQATFERERQLWQAKVSAEQDYLQAQTTLREATIAVDNARQKLAAIGAAGTSSARSALNRLEVRAPFDGTIVEKHLSRGEAVREDSSLFTVSDLRTVWAEFAVAPKDLALVRVGQRVVVSSSAFDEQVQGTIAYVGSLLGEQTRTARARVAVANPQGAWRPGLFVTVRVLGAEQTVPVAVPAEALQTVDGQPVVFKQVSEGFVAVPVQTGRRDGRFVEVLQGLQAGDPVATRHAFILKSELGKAGAEHTH